MKCGLVAVAVVMLTNPVSDPWKDESGKGRWGYERGGHYGRDYEERDGTTLRVGQNMDLRGPPAARSADGLLMFPLCRQMRIDAPSRRAIDQDLRRRSTGRCECVEYVYPNALRCPADEAIVECFARTIDLRASIQRPPDFRTWIMPLMTR